MCGVKTLSLTEPATHETHPSPPSTTFPKHLSKVRHCLDRLLNSHHTPRSMAPKYLRSVKSAHPTALRTMSSSPEPSRTCQRCINLLGIVATGSSITTQRSRTYRRPIKHRGTVKMYTITRFTRGFLVGKAHPVTPQLMHLMQQTLNEAKKEIYAQRVSCAHCYVDFNVLTRCELLVCSDIYVKENSAVE